MKISKPKVIMILIGFILILVGIKISIIEKEGVEVWATISNITPEPKDSAMHASVVVGIIHKVKVDYEYNGQEFKNVRYISYDSNMRVGDEIMVVISPDSHEICYSYWALGFKSFFIMAGIIVCVLQFLFGGIGEEWME